MRPAWRGIFGWLLFVVGIVVAATTPYPHNGQALAALVLGGAGILLVASQVRRVQQR